MMKKIILLSIATIMCLTITTKTNALLWKKIRTNVNNFYLKSFEFKANLSKGATWKKVNKNHQDEIKLILMGREIEREYDREPRPYHFELLQIITKAYANAILNQEKLAPRQYQKPIAQKKYVLLLKDLEKLQE